MGRLELYRRRMIPDELVHLKEDKILFQNENIIVTGWKTLHPKPTFDHGASCYFLGAGIKVSKFYKPDNSLYYWYCDIVDYLYDKEGTKLTVIDLLVDVIVYPDGQYRVTDLSELVDAFKQKLITETQMCYALRKLDFLLTAIGSGGFENMKSTLEQYEK